MLMTGRGGKLKDTDSAYPVIFGQGLKEEKSVRIAASKTHLKIDFMLPKAATGFSRMPIIIRRASGIVHSRKLMQTVHGRSSTDMYLD